MVEKLHCGQANNGTRVGKPPWRFLSHYPAAGHSPETSAHLLPRRRAADDSPVGAEPGPMWRDDYVSAAISASERPASERTSRVCSPRLGTRGPISVSMSVNLKGALRHWNVPAASVTSWKAPR